MSYLDTCIIIAYGFAEEPNHEKAEKLVQKGKTLGDFCASPFSLVELCCVLSRKIKSYCLPPWIEKLSDDEIKLMVTVDYLLKRLDARIPADISTLKNWNNIELFHIFFDTMELAQQIRLRGAGDTVHMAYVKKFKDEGFVKSLMTLDPGILCKKDEIEKLIEVKLL
jgi:predicted nucleic acid-binding protein